MAQTRRTRARSPSAPLGPPAAAATNEPTEADPSPPSTSSIPAQTPTPASPAKSKRKRPVEPNYAKLEEKAARAKRAKFAAVEVGGSGANGSTMGSAEGAAERVRLVGKKVKLQEGQSDYTITAPLPWRDPQTREFHFDDYNEFKPNMSPEEIIRNGAFDGGFFRPVKSKKSGRKIHEDWTDFPKEWYEGLDVSMYLTRPEGAEDSVNKWQARIGQPYEAWEEQGWLRPEHDARGWYQWYYRFFLGRRCDDDARQVQRWKGVAGPTGRFKRMFLGKYRRDGIHFIEPDEEDTSRGIRQTLNHWAYDPTTSDLNRFREEQGDKVANDDADA
ncbi:hypothetical protein JCM10296v2_006267 [Rhodotorula toruloides]